MKTISSQELSDLHFKSIAAFQYGSRIYGTFSEKSDYDFIYVVNDDMIQDLDDQYQFHDENISVYGLSKFQEMLDSHHIAALECYFLPKDFIYHCNHRFQFKLDLAKLRKSISEKTSHSWVKAKKKFKIEDDRNIYVAKKSLFHSMRIIDFGTQIAKSGRIENYHSCIELWNEIKNNPSEIWKDYEIKYKSKFNEMMSEFRKLAPKG